ncbi:MAG: FecR domain-containing protein [Armatimonadota bacterium]
MHYSLKRRRAAGTAALWAGRILQAALILAVCIGTATADNGIMLQIREAPLKDVVTLLMQQSGANVVIADSAMLEKKITASLNDVPLDKALDYIVRSAGVSYRKMEDGTYIIGGPAVEEPVISTRDVAPVLPPVEPAASAPPPKEKQVVLVKLTHSKASDILRLIGWNGTNPMPNTETLYPGRRAVSAAPTNPGGVYMNNSRTGEMHDLRGGLKFENGQPVVPTIDPTSLNYGPGRTADQFTGLSQYPERATGYPPGFAPGARPGGTTTQPQQQQQPTQQQTGNFLWPEGVDDARPFDLDNSIIVKGDEEGIEKFKKIIRMLDVPPKQVQVKAEFIEVSLTDVKAFGIDWSLQRLNESFATSFLPTGNVVVGFATGNLTAQLKTQLTSDVGRVINSPIISTINNQMAYISINRIIPYWVSIATVVGDNNIINQSTPQFIEINTELQIMPRVNGDGTITMTLSPQVSDTGQQIRGPDGTVIPEERQQSLFTQRRVANGETIVCGGFVRKNDTSSVAKVPILADLPIIGSLFQTTSRTTEDRELLIFVTPTIIPEVGGGTVGENVTL